MKKMDMNEKKWTTEDMDRPEPWEQTFYQTGSTHPPKNNRGLIAFLLIAVIFLSSLVSMQSVMNIRLFRQLRSQEDEAASVRFIPSPSAETPSETESASSVTTVCHLGFEGSILSSFDQQFYGLPQGVYITQVDPFSDAADKGICAGDVLVSINGVALTNADIMSTQLSAYQPGDTVHVVIYRSGVRQPVELTMEAEQ